MLWEAAASVSALLGHGPELLFHLHIPKTAGTALREALKRDLPIGQVLEWYPPNPYDVSSCATQLAKLLESNPSTRLISGHFLYGVHIGLGGRSYKFFTTVRDPIGRILSHFIHDIQNNLPLIDLQYVERLLESKDIGEYIADDKVGYYYNNIHARYISGISAPQFGGMQRDEIVHLCLQNIERDFLFVASQSTLISDAASLFARLRLSHPDLRDENSRGRRRPSEFFPVEVMRRLRTLNDVDYSLAEKLAPGTTPSLESGTDPSTSQRYMELLLSAYKVAIRNLLHENRQLRITLR